MISKEELAKCFRDAHYTEEQIERALKGQISSVLNKGKVDRIASRLQLLEELKLNKDKVIENIAILISGSNENIRENFVTLTDMSISKEAIENRLIILARGKKDKMQAIMQVLLNHKLTINQINSCLTLLMENEADEIDKILTTLEGHNINAEMLDEHTLLLLLAKRKEVEIGGVLDDLDEYNMDDNTTKACLRLIYDGKGTQLQGTAKVLKESNLSQEMKNRLLSDSVAGKINKVDENIITLLNCGLDLEKIERDTTLTKKSNVDEINSLNTALSKYTLTNTARENYLKQVYAHKWKPMYDIMQALENHNISLEAVEPNLEELLINAIPVSKEINTVLASLEGLNPNDETMGECLKLISTRTGRSQIQRTINSIETANVQPEVKAGLLPYLLKRKTKQIDERLITLVNAGIGLDVVLKSMTKVNSIEQDELQKRIQALQNSEHYSIPIATTENAMDIILKNTANEIDDIFTKISQYEMEEETQKRCLKLMATARGKEILSIIKSLEDRDIGKQTIKIAINDLLNSRPEVTEGILSVFEKHNIRKEAIEKFMSTKILVSAQRIDQTLTAYRKHNISPETIERTISHMPKVRADEVDEVLTAVLNYGILKKTVEEKINLLSEANAEEVKERIEAIKTNGYYNIPIEKVENCIAILLNNSGEEIKAILKTLYDNNISEENVHQYLIIVALEKSQQLENIFTSLKGYDLDEETINGCLKLITESKGQNIIDIIAVLKNYTISKETVEGALKDLLRNKPKDIDEMLTALVEHKISPKTIENSLKLLAQGYVKKDKVDKVLGAYEKYGLGLDAIESAVSGLGKAKVDEVYNTLTTLIVDYKIKKEAIENALSSLSTARTDEVKQRLETLLNNKYYTITIEDIEDCMSVLTRNTPDEILNILKVLYDNKVSEEAVKGCLSVLAYGNEKTVIDVIQKTKKYGLNIEDCMILLNTKNPERIDTNLAELAELENYGINKEAIQNCMSLIAKNLDKMHDVIGVIKEHSIRVQTVEDCLSVLVARRPKRNRQNINYARARSKQAFNRKMLINAIIY